MYIGCQDLCKSLYKAHGLFFLYFHQNSSYTTVHYAYNFQDIQYRLYQKKFVLNKIGEK